MYEKSNERMPKWAKEIVGMVKTVLEDVSTLMRDMHEVKRRLERIENLPTIKKELEVK